MKRIAVLLSALLLAGVLSACNNSDPLDPLAPEPSAQEPGARESSAAESALQEPASPTSEPEASSAPEESRPPSSQQAAEPEPASDADPPQPPASPYPGALLTVAVVDQAGNPVACVSGLLELGVATVETLPDGTVTGASSPAAVPLAGAGPQQLCTGADGVLYLAADGVLSLPQQGTLLLSAYYGSSSQAVSMDFSQVTGHVTVVWTGESPPTSPPDTSARRISFYIVDENGTPVPYVGGNLTQDNARSVFSRSLFSKETELPSGGLMENFDPMDRIMTDETGCLYLELEPGWENSQPNRAYRLHLYAVFEDSIYQEHNVELPDPPASYTITWTRATPPAQRPPQATGLRLFLVDPRGNPVQGVQLSGSPYPRQYGGEIPSIGQILGPSDENGYIRWDDTRPGTYDFTGEKDGLVQEFTFTMPDNQAMADIRLVWNPK